MPDQFSVGIIMDKVAPNAATFLPWAQRQEIKQVEIRKIDGEDIWDIPLERVKKEASILNDAEKKVSLLASCFLKCELDDPTQVEEHFKKLPKLIECAIIFGTNVIRAFAGRRQLDIPYMAKSGLVDHLKRALEILPPNFVLAVENEAATGCETLSDVARLCEILKDDRLGCLWDLGNYLYSIHTLNHLKTERMSLASFLDKELKVHWPIVKAIHLKNARRVGLEAETIPLAQTEGIDSMEEIDFKELLLRLRMLKIQVPIDLEPLPGAEHATADLKTIRRMINELPIKLYV